MNKNQCCPASIGGIFFLVNLDTFAYSNQLRTDSLQFFLGLAQKTSNLGLLNARLEMRSTPVKHPLSSTSSPLSQPPISAANRNGERASCQDHSENLGLYKTAPTDPRQDLTTTQPRTNNSGFGLSSPAPKQPYTKPFSGLPSGLKVTSPYREAGGTFGWRPGIVYPLLPRATRPDTKLVIDDAALPESAALGRQSRPPTVLDLEETREKDNQQPSQSKRQPRKRRRHRSTGVYRPSVGRSLVRQSTPCYKQR